MVIPLKGIICANLSAADIAANFVAGLGTVGTYVGWAICDGGNGTPNLTDKFIRSKVTGAGATGGADAVAHTHSVDPASFTSGAGSVHSHSTPSGTSGDTTLTTAQIPAHVHNFASAVRRYVADASGSGTMAAGTNWKDLYNTETDGGTGGSHNHTTPAGTSGNESAHTHSVDVPATTSGAASDANNMPAYYELVYLMRVV
jgi:hypothetical protein